MFTHLFLGLVVLPAVILTLGWATHHRFRISQMRDALRSEGPPLARAGDLLHNFRLWLRSLWLRLLAWLRNLRAGQAEDAPPPPAGSLPPLPAAPPVIPPADLPDDFADPGEVAAVTSSPVPPDHAAAIGRITGFEAENDAAWLAFMQGEAAAFLGYAEAWRAQADVCLNSVGMDPAAVQGTIELADVVGDTAHDVTLARRRFLVTYAATLEQIASGLVLPFHAREFLTGEGG